MSEQLELPFLEEELEYARQCTKCPRLYEAGFYGEHADLHHNTGRRRYWRDRERIRSRKNPYTIVDRVETMVGSTPTTTDERNSNGY